MSQLDLLSTSTFGLEAVVVRELEALGYEGRIDQPGRIVFRGDHAAIARTNLWLRSADRVWLKIGTFEARDFGALFDQTFALPWDEWLPRDSSFPVVGRSVKSQLSSVPACQKIVKKAVVEKLRTAHAVKELSETGATFRIQVALLEDRATLTLDTSGAGLHKRGYRTLSGTTQLKETLAAGMISLSFWRPDRPLLDPFCGTGTIPIEAALMGGGVAPGLRRGFAAEEWPTVDKKLWEHAREEAQDLATRKSSLQILGSDIDEKALGLARHHARQAGVSVAVRFERRAFADLRGDAEHGCLITNPPYGDRTEDREKVESLYREMPQVLRRLPTWSHYILTSHRDFERLIGQEADRRRKLYNGPIACTYFQFHGPPPDASTEEPVFGGLSEKALRQVELFRNRLSKRARHLRRWPGRGISCYRLYERDIKEVPLIVDRYGDCLHLTEIVFPKTRTPAEQADWLDLMARTAAEVMDIDTSHVFVKRRERQRGATQHSRLARESKELVVEEGDLRFLVNLSDYIDTGLFLDHRITRAMVREAARGKRFLNLFSYTGAFTVYAAAGGARSATSVDLSQTYLTWAGKNVELNRPTGCKLRYVRDDAMRFLEKHPSAPTYDLAVVDPPTFSNSKDLDRNWDIQRDHVALLNRVLELMTPGGVVFFSTNFRRFKFAHAEIRAASIEDITAKTIPPDFRNKKVHFCWRICRN